MTIFPSCDEISARHAGLRRVIMAATCVGLATAAASWFGTAPAAGATIPGQISAPKMYVHCVRDDRGVAHVLRWEYAYAFSSETVSELHIYRRVEGEEYAIVGSVNRGEATGEVTVSRTSANTYAYSYRDEEVQPGKTYSYKIVAFDASGKTASNEVHIRRDSAAAPVAGAANVLVVVNRSCPESVEIGEYYQKRREIPRRNLLLLSYEGNREIVSLDAFEKRIRQPIREYLASNGLKDKILYIVMTYGLPYKISVGGGKGADSVDAYLTDLFEEYAREPNFELAATSFRYRNPYYLAGSHFSRANGNRGYLVARLDGPLAQRSHAGFNRNTAHRDDPLQYLKNMVDGAIQAERNRPQLSGKGYFDRRFKAPWELPYGKGDRFIHGAYDCCRSLGFQSVLDVNPQLFGTSPADSGGKDPLFCDGALWYAGWYSHFYKDVFGWAKGAVGFHIESWTAQNMRTESKYAGRSGWLWVPGMIEAGITATMGPVHEPGLGGVPRIDWFFRYLFHGFSFAEAAYMANYSAGGQMVMIGDPLYTPLRDNRLDRTAPAVTITSPKPGETVRGAEVRIEGTVDDSGISMLDNSQPVQNGRFSYRHPIGTSRTSEARIPLFVAATDTSGNTATATVTVNWVNVPPQLRPIPATETSEGKPLTFTLEGSDEDGDRLFYNFAIGSARPNGASLNYRTGVFRWKPEFDQAGEYDFAFQVTDGPGSDVKRVKVTVREAGSHPPKFVVKTKKIVRKVGEIVYLELNAEDLDGDTLTFATETPLPRGATILQAPPSHAALFWKPAEGQIGSYEIVFTVTDGKGGRDTAPVEVEVVPASR